MLNKNHLTQADRCELFGQLIDVVEDWLEEKGITPEMIPNDEREEGDDSAAIIYGADYDDLADRFSNVLGISRDEPKMKNEVYLRGYFYFKTNASSVEEAMEELETLGLNIDNASEIELRDSEGNTLDTLEDKER